MINLLQKEGLLRDTCFPHVHATDEDFWRVLIRGGKNFIHPRIPVAFEEGKYLARPRPERGRGEKKDEKSLVREKSSLMLPG